MKDVALRPWGEDDLALLAAANTPEMTRFLNGPEPEEDIAKRHQKYLGLADAGTGAMFAVVSREETVGSIGWWDSTYDGQGAYETGWFTLPDFQGRGYATAAVTTLVRLLRFHRRHDLLTAYPSVDNAASNALCAATGFAQRETIDEELRGRPLRVNAWVLDLSADG